MIHIPGNMSFLFHLLLQPEYPWRPPCAMARSQNAQAMAGVKQVPKDLGKAQTLGVVGRAPSFTLGAPGATWVRDGGAILCQAVAISLQTLPLIRQGDDSAWGVGPCCILPVIPTASEARHEPEPQHPMGLRQSMLRRNSSPMTNTPTVELVWAQRAMLTPCHPFCVSEQGGPRLP